MTNCLTSSGLSLVFFRWVGLVLGRRYFFWFCASFVATVMICSGCETFIGAILLAVFTIGASAAVLCAMKFKKTAALVVAAAALSLVWQSVYFTYDKLPPEFFETGSGIEAEVTSYSQKTDSATKFEAAIPYGDKKVKASVYAYATQLELKPGDKIIMDAKLHEYKNTEHFAQLTYYKSRYRDVRATASKVYVTETCDKVSLRFLPAYLAMKFKVKTDEFFSPDGSAFLKSLILGDKSGLSKEFREALRATGLSHAVSVSGMHISFLIGLLLIFSKKNRLKLLAIPLMFVFAFVVGAPQSALRAVIMQTIVISSQFIKREYDSLTALSTAAFVLVFINPYCATDIAFLLSFSATLGIILMHSRIYGFLCRFVPANRGLLRKIIMKIYGVVSVSVSATLFTIPISAFSFEKISLISLPTNVLLNFVLEIEFVSGFLITLLGFIYSPLAKGAAFFLDFLITSTMNTIKAMSTLPFAEVFTGSPVIIALICFACFMVVYLISVGRKRLRPTVAFILTIVVAICTCFADFLAHPVKEHEGIRFDVLDVGQGQCVVATAGQTCAVIDCGGDREADKIAISHILGNRIPDIDALILTHAHSDHANGAEYLTETIKTKSVYMPATDRENATFILLEKAVGEDCDTVYVSEDTTLSLDGMEIRLLTLPPGNDENENGIVVIVSDGEYDTLITGDIPTVNEKLILTRIPDCESYIVGHHGSKSSSSLALLNKALPELAVISVGVGNTYGHPSPQAISRLEKIGASIFRTDIDGTVTFYSRESEGAVS